MPTKISADGMRVIHADCDPASTMTLRDFFASAAMQALIANAVARTPSVGLGEETIETLADEAYIIAEQMITARDIT